MPLGKDAAGARGRDEYRDLRLGKVVVILEGKNGRRTKGSPSRAIRRPVTGTLLARGLHRPHYSFTQGEFKMHHPRKIAVVLLGLIGCALLLAISETGWGVNQTSRGEMVASRYPLRTRTSGFYDRSKISNVPSTRRR